MLGLTQPFHAGVEQLGVPNAADSGVNLSAQLLSGQVVQIGIQILSHRVQEGTDLLIVDHTHQWDAVPGGEDQRVQPH